MKWISVKDKLPLNGQKVLTLKIFLAEYGWTEPWYYIDSGWYSNKEDFIWNGGGKTTHWMPLPELPKENE